MSSPAPAAPPAWRRYRRDILRLFLGISLLPYGVSKLANLQFPQSIAFFDTAIERLHGQSAQHLSGLSVFLLFFSFSRPYQIATGLIEILAATLLFWRGTWPLGAVLYLAVLSNVLLVDLCYRVWLNGTLMACVLFAGILALLVAERERFIRSVCLLLREPAASAPPQSAAAQPTNQPTEATQGRWYPVQVFVLALVMLFAAMVVIEWTAAAFTAH